MRLKGIYFEPPFMWFAVADYIIRTGETQPKVILIYFLWFTFRFEYPDQHNEFLSGK
jgi:hypothetical protein